MIAGLTAERAPGATPVHPVTQTGFDAWVRDRPGIERHWLESAGFEAMLTKPFSTHQLTRVLSNVLAASNRDVTPEVARPSD